MNKYINKTFLLGAVAATGALAISSCSDTWNDHYETASVTTYEVSTFEAIEEMAPDFADVIKAVGFDRELNSDNVYTIWIPETFDKDSIMALAQTDSAAVVDKFLKNHIARYAMSMNGTDQDILLMSEKRATMTAAGMFSTSKIVDPNISCKNGVVHVIDTYYPYQNNLFEQMKSLYLSEADSISMYGFLKFYDKDSLDEARSVSRGVDENGNKIWVDSVVIRNNTVLKNIDALIYEEDSSYIAFLPSNKAYQERYELAKSLLIFNPWEDVIAEGACDSLQSRYAHMFALTDLFYNKNANEHMDDSLKSTNYLVTYDWPNHVYYRTEPLNGLHPDKQINDIIAKGGTPIECSNGQAYMIDEYPFSPLEQFFTKKTVWANRTTLDMTSDEVGKPIYTKNVGNVYNLSGTFRDYQVDTVYAEDGVTVERVDSTYLGTRTYRFMQIPPSSSATNPTMAFQITNNLAGTYDLYLVTCPIWAKNGFNGASPADDPRGYRFYTYVFERENDPSSKNLGEYPTRGERLTPPEGAGLSEGNYYITDYRNKIDTLYLGEYTFKNTYYGRSEEGVLIQIAPQITSRLTSTYSREMLITSIILRPKLVAAEEAGKRK